MNREDNNFFEEPVRQPIEDSIDLHTFSPKDLPDLLENYLEQCYKAGLKEVRIIHGKGIGMQRETVHKILRKNHLIDTFYLAPPQAGGWGATIAILKKNNSKISKAK